MNAAYEVTKTREGVVYRSPLSASVLSKVDAVVFDCDGTLIDVRDSYDTAIIRTVMSMVESFFGRVLQIEQAGQKFILQIRHTGGFNADWDITYAITLFAAAALGGPSIPDEDAVQRLAKIVDDFASRERLEGWRSVDRYMVTGRLENQTVRDVRRYLGYPGNPLTSRLAATFDQVYYGENLYKRVYGLDPEVRYEKGLIESEKVMVTTGSLDRLVELLGEKRMAMATGRPFVAVQHTLGRLLDYFERDASVYIGDGDIYPDLAPKLSKFKKPSGESLLLARRKLSSEALLYVGDSAEDRLMVPNAGAPKGSMAFAGIYGSSFNDQEQISYFTKTESDLIVKSVNQIPPILERARA